MGNRYVETITVELPLVDARLLAFYFKEPIPALDEAVVVQQRNFIGKLDAAIREEKDGLVRVLFSTLKEEDASNLLMMQFTPQIVAGGLMQNAAMLKSVFDTIEVMGTPLEGTVNPEFPAGDFAAVVFWLQNNPLPGWCQAEIKTVLEEKLKAVTEGKSAHEIVAPMFHISSLEDVDFLKLMAETMEAIAGRFMGVSQATFKATENVRIVVPDCGQSAEK